MYLCFFTIADLSIYLYLTYCKPWQSINMNVVPPLPWEMSSINSKFMIVFILENLFMCRHWIPRWDLRLFEFPDTQCRMIFANYSPPKSSKFLQDLLFSSQEISSFMGRNLSTIWLAFWEIWRRQNFILRLTDL